MAQMPPFEKWNEQDVRENVIRPFIHSLGYSDDMVTTELPLKYERQFLGRKKPDKDPVLRGKADYIIELDGRFRLVIEAKPPGEISDDDREQAYSYAMHPEVRALIFAVISGTHFEFYHTFEKPTEPLLKFTFAEAKENFNQLKDLVSPEAVRRHFPKYHLDAGKPLAPGLRSFAKVERGQLVYTESPPFMKDFTGFTIHIKEGSVVRRHGGGIVAIVKPGFPSKTHNEFAKAIAAQEFEIGTDADTISTDRNNPTVFTHRRTITVPKGTVVPDVTDMSKSTTTAQEFSSEATVEVRGYLTGREFKATLVASSVVALTGVKFRICGELELTLS